MVIKEGWLEMDCYVVGRERCPEKVSFVAVKESCPERDCFMVAKERCPEKKRSVSRPLRRVIRKRTV